MEPLIIRCADPSATSSSTSYRSSPGAASRTGRPAAADHSSSSSRVMPARQPLDSGGVTSSPSRSTKTFDAVPSHSSPTVLASTASSAPRRYASATRDDVLRVGRRLQAGDRRPLVAHPRHADHPGDLGPRAGPGEHEDALPLLLGREPVRAQRSRSAGERDPQTTDLRARVREHRRDTLADGTLVGRGQAQAERGPLQAAQVAGQRERRPVVHRAGLEHAVADREPVVDAGQEEVLGTVQTTVRPDHDTHRVSLSSSRRRHRTPGRRAARP